MRPMDQHDNPQNSINNVIKPGNSNHSSPVATPSSPPPLVNIRINSILRVTTIFDVSRVGKVMAYDSSSNLVTLRK
jgi:hypothetical protein